MAATLAHTMAAPMTAFISSRAVANRLGNSSPASTGLAQGSRRDLRQALRLYSEPRPCNSSSCCLPLRVRSLATRSRFEAETEMMMTCQLATLKSHDGDTPSAFPPVLNSAPMFASNSTNQSVEKLHVVAQNARRISNGAPGPLWLPTKSANCPSAGDSIVKPDAEWRGVYEPRGASGSSIAAFE